jgi:hypothetical protein
MSLPKRPKGSADKYVKLDPDTSVDGVMQGKPSFFYRAYEDGKYVYSDDHQAGYAFRFQINFVVRHPDGALDPKIFEGSGSFYDNLQEFSEDYNVEKTWIKIKRKGTGKDTRYTFIPLSEHKVTEAQAEILEKAELHELRGMVGAAFGSPLTKESDVPF